MSDARAALVEAAIRGIEAFHAAGAKLPAKGAHAGTYGKQEVGTAGGRFGLSGETARQARQFADPEAGYTAADLEALYALMRAKQPRQPDGSPVYGRTHAVRLLSVRPKRDRVALQRAAVAGAWSAARLAAEIAARYGPRRAGGRRPRVYGDETGLLGQLDRLCEGWRRLLAAVDRPRDGEEPPHVVLADLPKDLRTKARAAGASVHALQRAIARRLKSCHPDRLTRAAVLTRSHGRE